MIYFWSILFFSFFYVFSNALSIFIPGFCYLSLNDRYFCAFEIYAGEEHWRKKTSKNLWKRKKGFMAIFCYFSDYPSLCCRNIFWNFMSHSNPSIYFFSSSPLSWNALFSPSNFTSLWRRSRGFWTKIFQKMI